MNCLRNKKVALLTFLIFGLLFNACSGDSSTGVSSQPDNGSSDNTDNGSDPPVNEPHQKLRPPAYPLITVDPYFSIWAFQDKLYNGPTRHWTGKANSLNGILRVDGKALAFMGQPNIQYKTVLPLSSQTSNSVWKYTFDHPRDNWQQLGFDASSWKKAKGAFSDNNQTANSWTSHDIYVRRTFNLEKADIPNLLLNLYHDDNVSVYINGVLAFRTEGWVSSPERENMSSEAVNALHKGTNVLAIHCVNTRGGAYLDAGLVAKKQTIGDQKMQQKSVDVTATQTKYDFKGSGVNLRVTFTAPFLPDKLDIFTRPADYVTFAVNSNDDKKHSVQLYFSAAGNLAVNTPGQEVSWKKVNVPGLSAMKVGTSSQHVLGRKGDRVRIDWGYFYLASPNNDHTSNAMAVSGKSIQDFASNGSLTIENDKDMPRPAGRRPIALSTAYDYGTVDGTSKQHHIILAYDEIHPIEYFHQRLDAYWKKSSSSITKVLEDREQNYDNLMKASDQFDATLQQKANAAGGDKYAQLVALAYRQSIAAHKAAIGPNGKLLFFSKENASNGSIGTVDINYPASPLFLYYNPKLVKGMMRPIFDYTESGRWTKPFAAHDVGTYPIANGQTYGGDMPIEETGNMIIMSTAIAELEGNAEFANKHWQTLSNWASYLLENGLDPKNQLSTDDFAGHLAHNANLSIKAIIGIAGYGRLAKMLGKNDVAEKYMSRAKDMAKKWMDMAGAGDHYVLAFGRPDTWSQKYNLAWDDILDLNIFPDKINKTEVNYYLTKQNEYGLPLDNRANYTKSDWINWTATLAKDKVTFEKFIDPLFKAFDETRDRVPMTDWYMTNSASQRGFRARSVVGGYFMKMLEQKMK